jgi:hypothetical protein
MTYYYGPKDGGYLTFTDPEEYAEDVISAWDHTVARIGSIEIYEFKPARSAGRVCSSDQDLFDPDCPCCDYEPRNKVKGICRYNHYGLELTGRKYEYSNGELKKIRPRKRSVKK